MNSTVNSTGWIVTSDSCIGSREMCTRFRRVIDTTFLTRSATPWVISRVPAGARWPESCLRSFALAFGRARTRPSLPGAHPLCT